MLAAAPAAQQILLSTPGGASGEFHRAWSSNEDWERVQRSPPINARASPRRLRRRLADPNLASQSVAIYTGSLPRRRARRRAFNGLEGDELSFALDQDDRCGVKLQVSPLVVPTMVRRTSTDLNISESNNRTLNGPLLFVATVQCGYGSSNPMIATASRGAMSGSRRVQYASLSQGGVDWKR